MVSRSLRIFFSSVLAAGGIALGMASVYAPEPLIVNVSTVLATPTVSTMAVVSSRLRPLAVAGPPTPAVAPHRSWWRRLIDFVNSLPWVIAAIIVALAALPAVLVARGFLLERLAGKREIQLRSDIGELQRVLLPEVPAQVGALATAVAYRPASGLVAGGDFFDVFELPDGRVVALIGDVSGHGQLALAQTAFIHYGLRAWMKDGFEPRQALGRASSALGSDLEASFVTALICVYDPRDFTLTWASAGHHPPLFAGAKPQSITVANAPPVGMGMRSGQRQTVVSLPPDVLVCLHTDGLNEARTPGGRLGEERVERLLESCNTDVLSAVALLDAVAAAADTSGDDMAAVLLRAELSAATTCETLTEDLEVAVDSDLAIVEQFVAAGGLSDSEVARAVAEVAAARGPGRPVLLRILSRTHTFEVQAAVFAESHIGPRCSPKPADS